MRGLDELEEHDEPSVTGVERILAAASSAGANRTLPSSPLRVTYGLRICACVTIDDSPTWVIYDDAHGIGWCQIPPRVETADVLDAEHNAGGHADPDEVLHWLEGKVAHPWSRGGYGSGDATVVPKLARRIQNR